MALVIGRYVNKIDGKGRISVPKPFRSAFARQDFNGIYAYPLFKHPAIEVCDEVFMTRISDSLDDLDMFSDDQDDLATVIMNNAEALPFDPEGRVVFSKRLLDHAGIQAEAVFVGRGRRFQVWHPDSFDAQAQHAFERARARSATLPLRSQGRGEE